MILFDESHEEFCSVSGKKKRKQYTIFAEKVGSVSPCSEREIFLSLLEKAEALVLAEPHAHFSRREVTGILNFVENGGGLVLIGNHSNTARYYAYGCNEVLNPLSIPFGMKFNDDEVIFSDTNIIQEFISHRIFSGISSISYWRGCSVSLTKNEEATLCAFAREAHSHIYPARPAVMCLSEKKVFAIGDSSVWSNPRDVFVRDNLTLAVNVLRWCAKT